MSLKLARAAFEGTDYNQYCLTEQWVASDVHIVCMWCVQVDA